jgi:hypothetical protein
MVVILLPINTLRNKNINHLRGKHLAVQLTIVTTITLETAIINTSSRMVMETTNHPHTIKRGPLEEATGLNSK